MRLKNLLLQILLCLLLLPFGVVGQPNLVPNGSFEQYTSCPTGDTQINRTVGWTTWNAGSPDYFNTCNTSGLAGVPLSWFGYQHPLHGNAYIGIVDIWNNGNHREYVHSQITPMQVGKTYVVSLFVSSASVGRFASNGLCVYFFANGPSYYANNHNIPAVTPQISFANYGPISDTLNWVRLSAVYTADSAYDNIVIGGFLSLTQVNLDTVAWGRSNGSYYFIDSVVVKLNDSLGFIFTDTALCGSDTISVPYFVNKKKQSNNVFTLQLSNASGNFATPSNIGSIASDTSGIITGVIPSSTPTGTGYKLRLLTSNFPDTAFESINIKIGSGPIAKPVANNNGPHCGNDTLKLSASSTTSGVSYSWTGANNFTSILKNPNIINPLAADSGNYIVTTRLHGCIAKDTTIVVVYTGSGPSGTLAGSNSPICIDDTLKLLGTANGSGNSYSWTGPNNFSSSQQNPALLAVTPALSGDYVLYASNGNCTSKDTVTVNIKPLPVFTASNNTPMCLGPTILFNTTTSFTGLSYSWTGPNSFNSTSPTPFISSSSPVHNGDYFVTATLNGCTFKDTTTVTIHTLPDKPVATNNMPLCAGDTIKLDATTTTSGVSYNWTGPGSFTSTGQNPAIPNSTTGLSGDYIVTISKNNCINKDTTTVTVKPMPAAVTLSNNTPMCAGDTLKLSSTASTTGVTYSWIGPNSFTANTQNTAIINAMANTTGWYKMTVGLNGCFYTDSTSATVHPIPATPVITHTNPLCIGETLTLNTGTITGATYAWAGPNNFSSALQNPARTNMQFGDTGTYSATVTVNNCISPAGTTKVNLNPLPFVVILSNPVDSICNGSPVLFTALPNNHGGTPQYQWYVNALPATTGVVFSTATLNDKDVIHCEMTENTKCSVPFTDASNDIEMTVLPWLAPTVSITANPAHPLDAYEYVTFTAVTTNAGNNPKYQWKRNGQNVVGATSSIWSANTLNDNDSIAVEIISNYKCPQPATATSNWIKVKMTGIGDVSANNRITVYPNPNNGKFIIEAPNTEKEDINFDIINTLGQVVYKDYITPANGIMRKEIDLVDVPKGVYMLRMYSDNEVSPVRINVR